MADRIDSFAKTDMPQGLTDWQVQDMRRKYPETSVEEVSNEESNASTMIYPRSRTYAQRHPHRGHPVAIHKPVLSSMPHMKHSLLRHPILRPELFDMLLSRMSALLSEKIKWR
jgi:hypothetical protein